jgi:predicted nucleic-acid-binding Zn-ribbon protein
MEGTSKNCNYAEFYADSKLVEIGSKKVKKKISGSIFRKQFQ